MPLHRIASPVFVPIPFLENPTEAHTVDDTQDTPSRVVDAAPVGFGVDWTFHSVPFHCSARGTVAVYDPSLPTATQVVEAEHDTPESKFIASSPVATLRTSCRLHSVPFHRSAVVELPFTGDAPMAVQAVADVHETLAKYRNVNQPWGVACIFHSVPFQFSAKVYSANLEGKYRPTAVQTAADVHETFARVLEVPSVGLGVV